MKDLNEILQSCTNIEPLAKGGQKTVQSATHPKYGEIVIKHGEYTSSSSLDRITREVNLLRDIDSPHYPKNYDFTVDPTSQEFLIIEERLDAVQLGQVSNRFSSDAAALDLLRNLVKALNVIWQRNVVHRDIKPANILITSSGIPKIIDLGIARFLGKTSLTRTAALRGPATTVYAAPEQLNNKKSMIGVRTDFFLLGIVTLELVCGFHPFHPKHVKNNKGIADNIINGNYVRPSGSNELINEFTNRVLKPEPFRRPRTVTHVADLLNISL